MPSGPKKKVRGTCGKHPDRVEHCHGMCASCYQMAWRNGGILPTPKPPIDRNAPCSACGGTDRRIFSRGMCQPCYLKDRVSSMTPDQRAAYEANIKRLNEKGNLKQRSDPNRRAIASSINLWTQYRLTDEDLARMMYAQGNACAICARAFGSTKDNVPCVDHDHSKGHRNRHAVRGILCGKCNFMIGLANDSCCILESAVRYLQTYGVTT